jgi:5-methylcytosine-specific restriction endonuclease McrA
VNPQDHAAFQRITEQRYRAMVRRFAARYNTRGHLIRPGFNVPFELQDFREWLRAGLGGEQGQAKCEYCARVVVLDTLEVDHRLPVSRGGSLTLDNLALACGPCNQQKGKMTALAFIQLLNFVHEHELTYRDWDPIDAADLFGRLQIATRLCIDRQRYRKALRNVVGA